MNHGELKCYGSPGFLKTQLAHGFKLNVFKAANFSQTLFNDFLVRNMSNHYIETNIAAEITIAMPSEIINQIPNVLKKIEDSKNAIGIESYGISSSTIEEVFLRLKFLTCLINF